MSSAQSLAIMTSVDFTMTETLSPFFSLRSSTASFVIIEVIVNGSLTSTLTTDTTALFSTEATVPVILFLALIFIMRCVA